ncbi:MAG: OmpA family protein [Desulfococcaceae bacterium]
MAVFRKAIPFLVAAFFMGCAPGPRPAPTDFEPVDLRPELAVGRFAPAVDRYLIILDASGSMGDRYRGRAKLEWAKRAAARLHQGMSGIPIPGAIRTVGNALSPFAERTDLVLSFSGGDAPNAFSEALETVDSATGRGVMGRAIRAAGADLAGTDGRTAVLLITDGLATDDPAEAASDLKEAMGEDVRIHGIWIGPEGHGLTNLEDVVRIGGGRVAMVEAMEAPESVAERVREIFLRPGRGAPAAAARTPADADGDGVPDDRDRRPDSPAGVSVDSSGFGRIPVEAEAPAEALVVETAPARPAAPTADGTGDRDGDGVPDARDRCADTPAGVRVDPAGCWIIEAILFGIDRAVIRPEYRATLEEVAAALRENPNLHLALQGHTDNQGDPAYNFDLSRRRAEAVADYLAAAGIDRDRLLPVGHGMARPAAENGSPEGRARNRRVEIEPLQVRD